MGTVLVTGASSGIGAIYARRLAARGNDMVIVARSADRLAALKDELTANHGVSVEILVADLTNPVEVDTVCQRLAQGSVDMLVNNAGDGLVGAFAKADPAKMDKLLRLNVVAPTMLASAVTPAMIARGSGAIINIASALALLPEYAPGIYPASKSYFLTFSQSLALELEPQGIRVQAVLPTITRTEIYERNGVNLDALSGIMEADDLVDAALVGFDRGETVTIPAVPDEADWFAFEQARHKLAAGFVNAVPAARYRS